MKITKVLLHGHRLLRKIHVTVTDPKGVVDSQTIKTDTFDYNHQDFINFKNPYIIKAGSSVQVTCDYDTSGETKETSFG